METYVGLTATEFKDRHRNHKTSLNNKNYSNATTLSVKAWELKKQQISFNIKWKIIGRAQPFSPISGVCNLCTLEKFIILTKPHESTLNKREEIFGACRHKEKVLLIPPRPKRWIQFGSEENIYLFIIMSKSPLYWKSLMIGGNLMKQFVTFFNKKD